MCGHYRISFIAAQNNRGKVVASTYAKAYFFDAVIKMYQRVAIYVTRSFPFVSELKLGLTNPNITDWTFPRTQRKDLAFVVTFICSMVQQWTCFTMNSWSFLELVIYYNPLYLKLCCKMWLVFSQPIHHQLNWCKESYRRLPIKSIR